VGSNPIFLPKKSQCKALGFFVFIGSKNLFSEFLLNKYYL